MPDSPLPLTADEKADLARLADEATPGPWTVSLARTLLWVMAPLRAVVSLSVSPPRVPEAEIREEHVRRAKADAAFIAAARTALPRLLADLAQRDADLARVEGERDEARARARAEDDAALRQIHDLAEDNDRLVRERDTAREQGRRDRDAEVAQARADERRAVVAWLRGDGARVLPGWAECYCDAYASAIERGAHIPPETTDAR